MLAKVDAAVNLLQIKACHGCLQYYRTVYEAFSGFVVLLYFGSFPQINKRLFHFSCLKEIESQVIVALGCFGVVNTTDREGVHQ